MCIKNDFFEVDLTEKDKALICIPYGGGWSSIFSPWEVQFGKNTSIIPVSLPGRGARMDEPSYEDFFKLVDDVAAELAKIPLPLYFYGGCFGGMCCYEIIRLLQKKYSKKVKHFFTNSLFSPEDIDISQKISSLDDESFIAKIREKKELPDEVLSDSEVLAFLLEGIRADYKLYESYKYVPDEVLIDCGITFIAKNENELKDFRYLNWEKYTKGKFSHYLIQSENLFIKESQTLIADYIKSKIGGQ